MFEDKTDLEARFWTALEGSPFVMLGLDGARDGHTQPMTAQRDGEGHELWFFAASDNSLLPALAESNRAIATFASKGHDIFASIHGTLSAATSPAMIETLWNPFVEAWFEGGKSDPKIRLLRLDPDKATIWKGGTTIGAALTRLFGRDPKVEYKDNKATVNL